MGDFYVEYHPARERSEMAKSNDHVQDQKAYRIRPATEDDLGAIEAINRRAWSGGITTHELLEQRHGPIDGRSWIEHIVKAVTTHLAEPDVTTFVAEQKGRIVGYAAAQIKREEPSPNVGIVSYNAVDPYYRRQGIGTALMRQVMSYLKEQGARVLVVWTLEAGKSARHVYERMGFKELTRFVYYSMDCQGDGIGMTSA
jgi:ribosomal protein S18 acetylase RimI-like enzyme